MAAGANAMLLNNINKGKGPLPRQIVNEVFDQVTQESAIMRVAGTTPMSIHGNTFVTPVGDIVAGVTTEGGEKPVTKGGIRVKEANPVKVAAIMYWSEEARKANPGNMVNYFKQQLVKAVQKAVDTAIIHGKDALTGKPIPGAEYIMQSTNTFELGTASQKQGGLYKDIIDGAAAVSKKNHSFDGFIADESLKFSLASATDLQGRPIQSSTFDLSQNFGNLMGYPVAYSRTVAGNVGAIPDTGVRAIGGNFADNIKLGFVDDIQFKITNEAPINDGGVQVDLWQHNLEAILVEATFAWAFSEPDAFAVYTEKGASGSTSGGNTGGESGAAA